MPTSTETTIEISHKGRIPRRSIDRAVEKVTHVAEHSRERVRHVEIRLAREPNQAVARPAIAEATLDLPGAPVRSQVAATTIDEAVDELIDRLRRRLDRQQDLRHRQPDRHRTGDSGPGEWRHGDLPHRRPQYVDIAFDERELRRSKTFSPDPMTVEEAVFDLEQLDHDFYLFIEVGTGREAVVSHVDDGTTELRSIAPIDDATIPPGVKRIATAPPTLTTVEATEYLEAGGDGFLFHCSAEDQRFGVLYRRFDGHYGLIGLG